MGMSNTVHRKIKFKQIGNDLLKLETANKYAFIRVPILITIIIALVLLAAEKFADLNIVSQLNYKAYLALITLPLLMGAAIYFINESLGFKPATFDFKKKIYYYGGNQKYNIEDIVGIQILTYHQSRGTENYRIAFELNLVKLNGERFNFYNNGNYQLIVKLADIIAKKLDIDVWDETE